MTYGTEEEREGDRKEEQEEGEEGKKDSEERERRKAVECEEGWKRKS